MSIADPGTPWTVDEARAVGRVAWVQVGALTRADFPAGVLSALARDRRLALDGQALVRPAERGRLVLDAGFDPEVLRHVTTLKLNEQELETLGGLAEVEGSTRSPKLLITRGSKEALVVVGGVHERLAVRRVENADPTGAGDAFLAAYVWARAAGHRPLSAARQAAVTAARALELGRVSALVRTVEGVFRLDVETETQCWDSDDVPVDHERLGLELPRLVAASAGGATVVALVDRRPPLLVSWDVGVTWTEAGWGLPPGFDVSVDRARPRPGALRRAQQAPPLQGRRPVLALARTGVARIEAVPGVGWARSASRPDAGNHPPCGRDRGRGGGRDVYFHEGYDWWHGSCSCSRPTCPCSATSPAPASARPPTTSSTPTSARYCSARQV